MANKHYRFEFRFCLHEKVISGRPEISSSWFPGKTVSLLKTNMAVTSITYTLIVLLIKSRNFQSKQNQFFMKRMNVDFKRIKKMQKFLYLNTQENGKFFCIFCNFLVRHLISSLFYKLTCSFTKRLK